MPSELSQEIPSSDTVDQGEGEDWDTVGGRLKEATVQPPPSKNLCRG
jgi:hypothetical protein